MAEITAALVKELREKTGAGMMDCKKALAETAATWKPRSTGCARRALPPPPRRPAASPPRGWSASLAERHRGRAWSRSIAETDFVARNEHFQDFVGAVAKLALGASDDRGPEGAEAAGRAAAPSPTS